MPVPLPAGPRPLVVAHRGASRIAPENTLAGFRAAVELGADAIELDVQRCADGHLVILHDLTLERTTDGFGPVAARSLSELKRLDAGRWFGTRFAGERIPTLEEALEAIPRNVVLFVELKLPAPPEPAPEGIELQLAGALGRAGRLGTCVISSFDAACLARAKAAMPEACCGFLFAGDGERQLSTALSLPADAVHPHWTLVSEALLDAAHRHGLAVAAWTVDDPDGIARLARAGVDAIITNCPDVALQALGRGSPASGR